MSHDEQLLKLIESARQDQTDALNQLAERIQARLYAYINRATLDQDLAQDLTQEVLLEMVKHLHDLENPERFWPWLYRIAQRKIIEHYRVTKRKSQLAKTDIVHNLMVGRAEDSDTDVVNKLMKKDLAKQTLAAMKRLKEQQRAILSLRCFDELSYADIAAVMECTEVKARVIFFRAKQALRKQLVGQGVDQYHLLACLGIFGKLTAPAEAMSASVAVAETSAKVSLSTTIIARITDRWTVSIGTVAAVVLALLFGMTQMHSGSARQIIHDRFDVKSMHYTIQLNNAQADPPSSLSKGAYEQWYYFPEDVDGPIFRRMQRWTPQQTRKQCAWLQNGEGHYYYASDYKTVTIHNYPICWSSLNVATLPTDPPEFLEFLEGVEHAYGDVTFAHDPNTKLRSEAVDMRFADAMDFKTKYEYNTLKQTLFTYDWDTDIPIIDKRDEIHKRGWTYFQVKGRIRDQAIIGQGQLPFTYNARTEHPAWITMTINNTLTLSDVNEGAWTERASDGKVTTYPPGTFFCGLMRPWMGLHTLDLIRRDAVRNRRWFKTEKAKEEGHMQVTVHDDHDQPHVELVYTVDMEHDLLECISFIIGEKDEGQLNFDYLDNVDDVHDAYVIPATTSVLQPPSKPTPELLWLFSLADGTSIFSK